MPPLDPPPRRHSNQLPHRYREFHSVTVYIIDDTERGQNPRPNTTAYRLQEEKCNGIYNLFTTHFVGTEVKSVRFNPYENEHHFTQYFRGQLQNKGDDDLVVVYFHCPVSKAIGNGESYEWQFCSGQPGPNSINACNFIEQLNRSDSHYLIILDGDMPTRFTEDLKRKEMIAEIFQAGKMYYIDDGAQPLGVQSFTRCLCESSEEALTKERERQPGQDGEKHPNKPKTLPELMRRKPLANNPLRKWNNRPKKESEEIVDRLVLVPARFEADGGLKFYRVRVQGPDPDINGAGNGGGGGGGGGDGGGGDDDDNDSNDNGPFAHYGAADNRRGRGTGHHQEGTDNDDGRRHGRGLNRLNFGLGVGNPRGVPSTFNFTSRGQGPHDGHLASPSQSNQNRRPASSTSATATNPAHTLAATRPAGSALPPRLGGPLFSEHPPQLPPTSAANATRRHWASSRLASNLAQPATSARPAFQSAASPSSRKRTASADDSPSAKRAKPETNLQSGSLDICPEDRVGEEDMPAILARIEKMEAESARLKQEQEDLDLDLFAIPGMWE